MSQRRRKAARSLTSQMTSIYWQEILVKEELPLKHLYADGVLIKNSGKPEWPSCAQSRCFPARVGTLHRWSKTPSLTGTLEPSLRLTRPCPGQQD